MIIKNEQEMLELGLKIAKESNSKVFLLTGELGVGKTTFAKGFLEYYGFKKVKSPTYNIIKNYNNEIININHIDAYRIKDEDLGFDEIFQKSIVIIEWWKKIKNFIPKEFIEIKIEYNGDYRKVIIKE